MTKNLAKKIENRTQHIFSNLELDMKSLKEDQDFGYFSGYAAVFNNIDGNGDIIRKGAFTKVIAANQNVQLLWNHQTDTPIGSILTMKEDHHGLWVEGRINLNVNKGRDAYALIKATDLKTMSIGFITTDAEWDIKNNEHIRTIKEVDLWEISLVPFPANRLALIKDVKSIENRGEIKSLGDVEKILREYGFSKNDSRFLISEVKKFSRCEADENIEGDGREAQNQQVETKNEFVEELKANDFMLQTLVASSLINLTRN